ncbi:phage tail tape measure protein [Pseudonocardia hydrocarbonoxydans]|uniref:Phage tail tape measure protein domain-containing protein n=1 Tax=Pseudonocardia hydrocarbonoxydans TaxID=76726 RepID=A0A4Y3WXF1_9PSEU|nr:phage tail tape measure protein [Pseudonocardia hydrocarbonoxydans]GEC22800.1 hypothetical protein PHY01_50830 [Pseudonocardia hydrocarbonoxydans]
MNIGELVAILRVDDSELEAGVDRGEERMRRMGGVAAAAGAAAGAALGAGLSSAMAGAIEMDTANARLQAQLGLTTEQAEQAGTLAGELWAGGFASNVEVANEAIRGVAQNMGVAVDSVDMQPLAEQALTLSDVFGVEVAESTRAAGQAMRNLGMDGSTAMDLIAVVTRTGGDRADDLADSLTEFSPMFQKLGLSGEQNFGIINQLLAAGAKNTDVAAGAIEEFSIRATDGSATAAASFEALGFNAEQMTAIFARGGPEAAAAFDDVVDKLRTTEGQANASEIAFGLFGTKAEELQGSLYALDPSEAVASMGDFAGTLDEAGDVMAETAEKKLQRVSAGFTNFTNGLIETEGPLGMVAAAVAGFGPAALSMIASLGMIGMAFGPLLLRAAVFTGQMLMTAGSTVLSWAMMAASSIASAAVMAASWLIAIAPIALVIAAVVGLAFLIYSNWEQISAWTSAAWGSICAFVADAWNQIVGFVQGGVENAKAKIAWFASLPLLFGQWFAGAVSAAGAKINELLGWLGSLPGRALGILGGLGSLLYNSGSALISGFWNGLTARWNQLMAWVRGAMANLRALWPFSPAKEGPFSGSGYVTYSGKALTGDFAASLRKGMPGVVDAARGVMGGAHAALTADMDATATGLPGNGWLSRATPGNTSTRHGDRVIQVTVNNPVAERASDTLGRRARTLAALGPFGGATR